MNEPNEKYFKFLEALRESGITNMYGATPYLVERFGIETNEARKILSEWMTRYNELADKYNW